MLTLVANNSNVIRKPSVGNGFAGVWVNFHTRPKLCRLLHLKANKEIETVKDFVGRTSIRNKACGVMITQMDTMIEEAKAFIEKQKMFIAKTNKSIARRRLRCV